MDWLSTLRASATLSLTCLLSASVNPALAQLAPMEATTDSLVDGFFSPPNSAKPRVWWHWLDGNITRQGIRLDLDWMHRIGLGGLQNFDAGYSTPELVKKRLVFMSPPWQEAFRYAVEFADRWDLEFAIAGSPGWSESGGPWVKSEDGMKKLVWSETELSDGVPFTGQLSHPPTTIGPFQNVPIDRSALFNPATHEPIREVYEDIAILAYKLPINERSMAELHPVVTSSAGPVDAKRLWDGDFTQAFHLPYGRQAQSAWIQMDFGHPQTMQSMTLGLVQNYWDFLASAHIGAELQVSNDGVQFHTVVLAYGTADQSLAADRPPLEETVTFAPVSARYFRLQLPTPSYPALTQDVVDGMWMGPKPTGHQVTELVLHSTPRVEHFEQKAAFFLDAGTHSLPTPHVSPVDVLDRSEIVDLTSRVRPDGTLDWTPPAGHWAILRVGYSLLGITNHPASPEGTGLEVDKLSRVAVKAHMDHYLGRYESLLGPKLIGSHGLRAMVNDSWEAGAQNWTPELAAEFLRRRGYSLISWLPALTGRIIGSAEETDRFLWDFRRTLGELLTENHYGQIAASLRQRNMIHYGESHEVFRAFIGDGMDVKRDDDIPMGAMWMPADPPLPAQKQGDADLRESASVAHLYGKNLVAAESMTTLGVPGQAFAFAPEDLKATADREFADGANLIVPMSVHQARTDAGPGVTLGPFGQWFTRKETWAEQAGPWVTYLSRSSYLLQQGRFVADLLYYYGQDSNITALYENQLPHIPEGYAFDFANSNALTKLSVHQGCLVTSSGMRYRLLALDPRATFMSVDVLNQIEQLVKAGATIVGNKPQATPSLSDDVAEFHRLADTLWGNGAPGERAYGEGRILSGKSISDVLEMLKLTPDFSYSKPEADATVWFVHRRLTDGDLYFINNRQSRREQIEARFRVSGKAPEVWHADTGLIEPASYRIDQEHTVIPLTLGPQDALFVVFRKPANQPSRQILESLRRTLLVIAGPWTVHFQKGRGAPDHAVLSKLKSWTKSSQSGIKYFSGTASYETSITVSPQWFNKEQRVEIDLGAVKNVAEVLVNGHPAGVLWRPPFRADVTELLQPGLNKLAIRVTNLWPNRLIGDKQRNVKPIALTTFNPYNADSPLLPSGLLGPVSLLNVSSK